jgi:FkbM family methyltransferase
MVFDWGRVLGTDIDIVGACYEVLLGRAADASALGHWAPVEMDGTSLRSLLVTILESAEFARRWKKASSQQLSETSIEFFNEQSQFGEIGRLIRLMVNAAAGPRIVIDVGANGRERSNSYDLMRFFGWRGLLIEANPQRNAIIKREFSGLDYTLVNCAISDYAGEAVFHLGVNDDVSSLKVEAAEGWGPVRGQITVEVKPLHAVLTENLIPHEFDLLSIDAEGEDIRILNDTIANGFCPRWVIMEAVHTETLPSLKTLGLSEAVQSRYEIIDSTIANIILQGKS